MLSSRLVSGAKNVDVPPDVLSPAPSVQNVSEPTLIDEPRLTPNQSFIVP